MKFALIAATIGTALLAAAPAAALTYAYHFSNNSGDAGAGFFTTATAGVSTITSVTGTINGSAVTGLSSYAGADNLFDPAGNPFFTFNGWSVTTASGTDYNIYFDSGYFISDSDANPTGFGSGFRELTDGDIVAVPEPATWGLLVTGFGIVGVAARRRKALAKAQAGA